MAVNRYFLIIVSFKGYDDVLLLLGVILHFVAIVSYEVFPMIVRGRIALEGQCCLVFVEQYLDQHILVLYIPAIEYKLDVACHWENLRAVPVLFSQS